MTQEERKLVKHRMERAHEPLEEAKLLLDAGHLHTYINRLYYACFCCRFRDAGMLNRDGSARSI